MARLQIQRIDSVAELRTAAPAWDDLWRRSDVTMPLARAELVAQWIEQFAPRANFRALVAMDGGQAVAALPLVERKLAGVLKVGGLPQNEWSPGGDLLLDPASDVHAALDLLVAAAADLPWQLLWFEAVTPGTHRWRTFLDALDRAGLGAEYHERCDVGLLSAHGDWESYQQTWSRNHRKKMTRCRRRLADGADVRMELHADLSPEQVEPILQRGFEVEDRSWKGNAGTSILKTPGMLPFFTRQARTLAEWGQLKLAFLVRDDRRIAFEYAPCAKSVYHSFKVGYDEQYAANSPGQLLMLELLRQMYREPQWQAIDCMGPINDALRSWRPDTYAVGRLAVAPHRLLGRALLHVYRNWWPQVRRLRGGDNPARPRKRKAGGRLRLPEKKFATT